MAGKQYMYVFVHCCISVIYTVVHVHVHVVHKYFMLHVCCACILSLTLSCPPPFQQTGFTVVADKLNFYRYLSHFRAVHRGAFFAQMRTTAVRKLLPEAWGQYTNLPSQYTLSGY